MSTIDVMKARVIFLDIDGVLNSSAWFKRRVTDSAFDPEAIGRLNRLCEESGALIVVSSSWRLFHGLDGVRSILESVGVRAPVVGMTDDFDQLLESGIWKAHQRGDEIAKWVSDHCVSDFVALDDSNDMDAVRDRFVRTDFSVGLTDDDVAAALALFDKMAHGD